VGFADATAVAPRGGDRWGAEIPEGWRGGGGPHGGLVAGLVLRAMLAELDDPTRAPRSLTVHFISPPRTGPCEIVVRVERAGRSVTALSARLEQDGEPRALGLAACSVAWTAPEYAGPPPSAPAANGVEPVTFLEAAGAPEFFANVEIRPTFGGFVGSGDPQVGGWIRPRPPAPLDAPTAAFLLDAWWPAVYALVERPVGAPTIDFTVHFRRPLPATEPDQLVLARFESRLVHEGFFDEDGELWAPDGRLLAHSRQLALLRP
jgi:acyl-CoA thioesterase